MKGKTSFEGTFYKFYPEQGKVIIHYRTPFPWTLTIITLPRGKY